MLITFIDQHVLHICVEVSHVQLLDVNQNLKKKTIVIVAKCGSAHL